MLRRVALVRTDIPEERYHLYQDGKTQLSRNSASSNSFSETSVLTRTTRGHILEDGVLISHRHENLKS
jgi:hypothetical protein